MDSLLRQHSVSPLSRADSLLLPLFSPMQSVHSHSCSSQSASHVRPRRCQAAGGDDNPDVCISRPTSISVIVDRRSHVVLSMPREFEVKVDSPQTNVTVSHRRLFVSMTRWTQPGVQTITESLLKRLILEQLTLLKFHSGRSKRCRDIRIEAVGYTLVYATGMTFMIQIFKNISCLTQQLVFCHVCQMRFWTLGDFFDSHCTCTLHMQEPTRYTSQLTQVQDTVVLELTTWTNMQSAAHA